MTQSIVNSGKGANLSRRSFMKVAVGAGITAMLGASAFSMTGCSNGASSSDDGASAEGGEGGMRTQVKLGYWSATECDASLLAAYLAGYYEEEGLEPELVLVDYNTWPAQVANGQVDQMMVSGDSFNPMAEGAEQVLVNGSHTGCSSTVVKKDSDIKSPEQLKGKIIGVDAVGGLGQVLMMAKLGEYGLTEDDVTYKVYDPSAFIPALEKGEIDAFNYWDPIPTQAIDMGVADMLFRMNDIYPDIVCCYEGISKSVVENEPELAKKLDNAFRRGTELCRDDPAKVAELMCSQKFLAETEEFTEKCYAAMKYWTDPADAGRSFRWWLETYQDVGVLSPGADIDEVFSRCFKSADEL